MAVVSLQCSKSGQLTYGAISTGIIALAALALVLMKAGSILPSSLWLKAVLAPSVSVPAQLLFHHSFLPRIAMALIAGAALALAGTIFQHVLRNPPAEPGTLGVSAGAQLALSTTLLWMPGLIGFAQGFVALAGSAVALMIVLALASARSFSPAVLIVAGLIVSLAAGSASAVLVVLNHDYLNSLFLFQSGSLAQNGWQPARNLLIETAGIGLLCALLVRPLDLMGLEDDGARSLGVPVQRIRVVLLALAVGLSACVTSAVGVIGFIGLAAPALARALGARTLRQRLVLAPLLGASLLLLTDQVVQMLTFIPQEIPTGAATGLIGAPLLIWLVFRMRTQVAIPRGEADISPRRTGPALRRLMIGVALALATGLAVALFVGRTPDGWHMTSWPEFELLSPWRTPRVFASLACGAMLAAAGVLMQRMTGNAMASPELLGISSGATVAVILAMLMIPGFNPAWTVPAACTGAALTLTALMGVSGRSSFAPERLLLVGVALASFMSAISSIALTSGDPRTGMLLTWMSGSTYGVTATQAGIACALAVVTLALAPFAARWLEILPLGTSSARGVGMNVGVARLVLLLLTALATAAATLVVGPLSFVGLMAPHMARMLGLRRPMVQLFGAAMLGALIMVVADWLGRNVLFPWQVPAGLIATLIGAPYLLWQMWRTTS
ncbi:MAG: Fe(3+)-hydroxamate ABC transporter permease FhuB [Rhizobiales bacterium]|nr:Fe(3+)-hydroxamate ABC transporter permease FhuB [Hyphomicrobiales bacterium]OJY01718.1 MAG: Fe3+-hydroxamate ABC transporter permease FhuB [Rhizobiales bacterium 63-22]